MDVPEAYRSLRRRSRVEQVINKSRFIGIAFPAFSEEEALEVIAGIRREFADCSSLCYGFVCGFSGQLQRFNDDHEPVGGMPILDAIRKRGLTGCGCAVVRYFGGVKLGMGGLARAFGATAIEAVDAAEPGMTHRSLRLSVQLPYDAQGKVDYFLAHSPYILEKTDFTQAVTLTVLLRATEEPRFLAALADLTAGRAQTALLDETFAFWQGDHV